MDSKKHKNFSLSIQKNKINSEESYELVIKKINNIPNWFIISKDENFFVTRVKRLLTFYTTSNKPEDKLICSIFGHISHNPYETQEFVTEYELFILDFINVINNKKDYYPYDIRFFVSDRTCPLCNKLLIKKTGRFGDFLGCQNYPICTYTENI